MNYRFINLTIVAVAFLSFGLFAFADAELIYERTPAGTEVESPVSFNVSWDHIHDIGPENYNYWGVMPMPLDETPAVQPTCVAKYARNYEFIYQIPAGSSFETIEIVAHETLEGCQNSELGTEVLEGIDQSGVATLTILESGENVITIPDNAVNSTVGYIGSLMNSVGPFIWLIIGIPLAFVLIDKVKKLLPKDKK